MQTLTILMVLAFSLNDVLISIILQVKPIRFCRDFCETFMHSTAHRVAHSPAPCPWRAPSHGMPPSPPRRSSACQWHRHSLALPQRWQSPTIVILRCVLMSAKSKGMCSNHQALLAPTRPKCQRWWNAHVCFLRCCGGGQGHMLCWHIMHGLFWAHEDFCEVAGQRRCGRVRGNRLTLKYDYNMNNYEYKPNTIHYEYPINRY